MLRIKYEPIKHKKMKTFIETIKKKLQAWHENRAARLEEARRSRLDAEARKVVQVMEFNGELYVSVHGVPLLDKDAICGDFAVAVNGAREIYKKWKEEKLWESGTTHGSTRC